MNHQLGEESDYVKGKEAFLRAFMCACCQGNNYIFVFRTGASFGVWLSDCAAHIVVSDEIKEARTQ